MNKVILMGRLVREPEVRYSSGERSIAIAKYTLAIDRQKRKGQNNNEQSADFINCVALDGSGKFAETYLHQGMKILVEGRWQTGNYTNKDGQKVYTNECIVSSHEFCESKGGSGDGGNRPAERPTSTSAIGDGFMNIPDGVEDDGLPFS